MRLHSEMGQAVPLIVAPGNVVSERSSSQTAEIKKEKTEAFTVPVDDD
jgi:hypothetical protein